LSPWLDEEMLSPGSEWDAEIRAAIRRSRYFIACFSCASVTKAGYVQRELRLALDVLEEKPPCSTFFIPALLEEVALPRLRVGTVSVTDYQWVRLYEEGATDRLIATLRSELGISAETEGKRAREELVSIGHEGELIVEALDRILTDEQALNASGVAAFERRDFETALRHFRGAYWKSSGRRPEIATNLAVLYARGLGVPKDTNKAIELLRPFEAQHPRAKGMLGRILWEREDPDSMETAIRLLREASDAGDLEATAYLGLAYLSGLGVGEDTARGLALLMHAAQDGSVEAQSALSLLYKEGGLGIPSSQHEAIKWAGQAAARGDKESAAYLESIAAKIDLPPDLPADEDEIVEEQGPHDGAI
jgi:hypothetical protein